MEKNTQCKPAEPKWIREGAHLLREGKLVVFPTETVYGIGANGLEPEAVKSIFVAKGRPQDNPLILHVASVDQIASLVREFPLEAQKLAEAFWPGPLTLILPKSDAVPFETSGGLDTVALRIPSHPVALQLLKEADLPVAAPSANRSGSPSPTNAEHVWEDLRGRVDLILDGGATQIGIESTVLSLVGTVPTILRPGAITAADLEPIIGEVALGSGVLSPLEETEPSLSPGTKYRHYAPKAQVFLVHGTGEKYAEFVNGKREENIWAMGFEEDLSLLKIPTVSYGREDDFPEQATKIFALLRELDHRGAGEIYIHAPKTTGDGLAIYNRLLRASAFQEIYV